MIKDLVTHSEISSYKKYISNYDNVDANKTLVYSPKNKRYTLSVGILNSQNEFLDITNTLCRWELKNGKSQIIDTYKENPSDLYKFNRGYFIAINEPEGLEETIADSKLIKKRLVIPANTYAYKLVGPMYLKVNYNHINDFSYSIVGEKKSNGKWKLTVRGIVTYNCPDSMNPIVPGTSNSSIPNYYTLEEVINTENEILNGFDFFDFRTGIAMEISNIETYIRECRYNEINNLYIAKIDKIIDDIEPNKDGRYFDYVIAAGEKNLYLRGLTETGTIDFNLLGSGATMIDGWRFENDFNKKETYLRFSFQAYPKPGQRFLNLSVKLGDNIATYEGELGVGNITLTFTNLLMQKLYIAEIKYEIYDEETGVITTVPYGLSEDYPDSTDYWVLTTELFNDCFYPTSANFVYNYVKPKGSKEISIIANKLIIVPKFEVEISDNSGEIKSEILGLLLSNMQKQIEMYSKLSKDINISIKLKLDVDKTLYPDYLEWEDTIEGSQIQFLNYGITSNAENINSEILEQSKKINGDSNVFQNKPFVRLNNLNGSNGKITGTIDWYDRYITVTKPFSGTIINAFDTLKNYIDYIFLANNRSKYISYTGFVIDGEREGGSGDEHYLGIIVNYKSEFYNKRPYHGLEQEYYREYNTWKKDTSESGGFDINETNSKVSINEDRILLILSEIKDSVVFAYLIWNGGIEYYWMVNSIPWNDSDHRNPHTWANWPSAPEVPIDKLNKSRFMWKTSDGNWAFIDGFFPDGLNSVTNSVMNLFQNLFLGNNGVTANDIYICRYSEYDGSKTNLYVADKSSGFLSWRYSNKLIKLFFRTTQILFVNDSSSNVLHFTGSPTSETNEVSLFSINSSQNFIDYIETFRDDELSNIDINNGRSLDSNGYTLNKNSTYILKNNTLKIWENSPIDMVKQNPLDTEYSLRCKEDVYYGNGDIRSRLSEKAKDYFAPRGTSSDRFAWITYDSVHKVSKDKLKCNE